MRFVLDADRCLFWISSGVTHCLKRASNLGFRIVAQPQASRVHSRCLLAFCLLLLLPRIRLQLLMAPNLSKPQRALIEDVLSVREFSCVQIADAAECHVESVRRIRRNLRYFGEARAPENAGGRPPSLTQSMFEVLCEHLLEKPGEYLDQMAIFLWDEFGALFDPSTISRSLSRNG